MTITQSTSMKRPYNPLFVCESDSPDSVYNLSHSVPSAKMHTG